MEKDREDYRRMRGLITRASAAAPGYVSHAVLWGSALSLQGNEKQIHIEAGWNDVLGQAQHTHLSLCASVPSLLQRALGAAEWFWSHGHLHKASIDFKHRTAWLQATLQIKMSQDKSSGCCPLRVQTLHWKPRRFQEVKKITSCSRESLLPYLLSLR